MSHGVVIVGASVGGVRTALSLREEGYDGPITVVEAESHPPYDKPPLSKQSLDESVDALVPLLTSEQATERRIDLELGVRAESLDLAGATITVAGGRVIPFDDLVIATGVSARPSPWGALPGVVVVRSLDDALELRRRLASCTRVLVIGAGFIGSEVASSARARGLPVTMVDPAPVPMARIMGDALGERFNDLHRRFGVDTRFGCGVERLESVPGGIEATLTDGSRCVADLVVVGIGAQPNTEWLGDSGLPIDNGVECDDFSRAVGHSHVHVAGDVARWFHRRHQALVRVEHWTNAVEQAACVAHNIVHPDEPQPYEPVEYVWSDQYDWKIQIFGRPMPSVLPVVLEQEEPFRLAAFWAAPDGVLAGGVTVNWPRASVAARRALAAGGSLESVTGVLAPKDVAVS